MTGEGPRRPPKKTNNQKTLTGEGPRRPPKKQKKTKTPKHIDG
ncbi:hypothetical protein N9L68_00830 [bacterium]|nr:hypothetical protein [bacterium]MDA8582731.1 hypothetical protein [bacterium]